MTRRTEYALGTVVTLEAVPDGRAVARALRQAGTGLRRADEVFSVWKPDSPISRLRRDEQSLAHSPPEIAEVLGRCAEARRLTGGWYDPWAGPDGVDPTDLARGWAVGQALGRLRAGGATAALVTAGDMATGFGRPAPDRSWQVLAQGMLVSLDGLPAGAVATVVDDRSGTRATVVGPEPGLTSALAIALRSSGPVGLDVVDGVAGYGAVVVDDRGRWRASRLVVSNRRTVRLTAA
ncbi:MAG TPA: FAD:protein FMN transferase [Acidimicrobiales bacterium]